MKTNLFRPVSRLALTAAGLTLLVLGPSSSAFCQTSGQHDYETLCASCHGADGTGKGAVLTEANPPDLTELSLKNGGKFPFAHVYRAIDGREMSKSHKRFAMPFWGEYLQQHQGPGSTPASEAAVKERIVGIVRYLETIQRK